MHYLTLFHYFLFRLYSVLRANDAYALPSSTLTSQVLLAVGSTSGLLALAIAVLGPFYPQRRRRRNSALLDARPRHTPPAQGDQLPDAPQEIEHRSQPTRPPTHGSTLSSSATFPRGGSSRSGEVAKMDLATPVEVIEILEDEDQGEEPPKPTRWWDVNRSRGTRG